MKWHNGKYERVFETTDFAQFDGDSCWIVEIYVRNPRGALVYFDGCLFFSRSLAVAFAAEYRIARKYPGRLLNGGEIYE